MELIDVHTHIHFPVYDSDREAVISRAKAANVKMIAVGTQISTSASAIKLAEDHAEDIWAAVGFHPSHAVGSLDFVSGANWSVAGIWRHDKNEQEFAEPEKFDIEKLKELAEHPKVVAIGECGLDYFRIKNTEGIIERQKEVFAAHLDLAYKTNKPIMIHCRNAFRDLIDILNSFFITHNSSKRGVVHFFTGTKEDAKKLLDMGFCFTFGGVVTFARDYDEVIKYTPVDRILTETDAPYVAPVPYRGKKNEPAYIVEVVKKLSEIKGVAADKFAEQVFQNAVNIFNIG